MPDISLLSGPSVDAKAMWSLDPKHSEAGGYTLSDYKETAERYKTSFGADLSLVAEYFDKSGLGLENPVEFAEVRFSFTTAIRAVEGLDCYWTSWSNSTRHY